jgi:hypothetical protein
MAFQLAPLIDAHADSHLHSSPGHDLGAAGEARLEQLAEARFGIPHRPAFRIPLSSHSISF